MELYHEIVVEILSHQRAEIIFPDLDTDLEKLAEPTCYQVLKQIRAIVRDDSLSDPQCFAKVEAIICALERAGFHGGSRHDWG